MPRPNRVAGRIIEALARAGLFPDHAVLIGEAAYQTYGGLIGVRLAKPRTAADRDRSAVEIVVRDSRRSVDILKALRIIDPSFAAEPETTATYTSSTGVQVGVTSLDRASDATANRIGLLIANPVRAIVLHGAGIPVTVPAPERFASYARIDANPCTPLRDRLHFDPAVVDRLSEALVIAGRSHALEQALAEARSIAAGT